MTIAATLGAAAVVVFYVGQRDPGQAAGAPNLEQLSDAELGGLSQNTTSASTAATRIRPGNDRVENQQVSPVRAKSLLTTRSSRETRVIDPVTLLYRQSVDCLVSPHSSFAQRQAALEQLRDAGKLDQAIAEIEEQAANNPYSAECPAAPGYMYLQKAGTLQDIREQGILGMKADQVFDAALNLDPSNWEARFTKAVAMSYWPTQLNKGTEVMQHFVTLIEQQEAQTPEPQFAETYVWLGQEYQKYGHQDYARQIWERGAALFPTNERLLSSLGR